ncbi:MAG: hypothetical protein CL534_01245 [Ahrensia sp.]|nr:hypothetical protein [Ahrensia sp.]
MLSGRREKFSRRLLRAPIWSFGGLIGAPKSGRRIRTLDLVANDEEDDFLRQLENIITLLVKRKAGTA